jgi:hypothetical protein
MKKNRTKGRSMDNTSAGGEGAHDGKRGTGGSVEGVIGSRLRAYYDEVAREPVPDRFVELLKRLNDETDDTNKA